MIMYYVIQILLFIAILIMLLVAKENYKDGKKREFKKDGKIILSKVILYIILFPISYQLTVIIFALIMYPIIYMLAVYMPQSVESGFQLVGIGFCIIAFGPLFFIKKMHRLIKYIVLAFPN